MVGSGPPITPRRHWLGAAAITVGALLLWQLAQLGAFDPTLIGRGLRNLAVFAREAVPPDASIVGLASRALLETVQIAFAGTILGFVVAVPLAMLSTRLLMPRLVSASARLLAAALRTVPALLWAVLFVILVGLGPLAGTLSIACYTIGYLAKLYGELFEGTDPEVLEAVRGVGASIPALARFVVVPEGANAILSQLLFMFEYNIRASSILGFVGAGGIGFLLHVALQTLDYQRVATVLLLILVLVLAMDALSGWLRRHVLLSSSR